MPNLKNLLDELAELSIDPRQLKLPSQVYDEIVQLAEEIDEENDE